MPVARTDGERDRLYEAAEVDARPYLAVEDTDRGWGVVYDLLPANAELTEAAAAALKERLVAHLEDVIGDPDRETSEVGHSVEPEMGTLYGFATEETAREVGELVADVVLDRSNWQQ